MVAALPSSKLGRSASFSTPSSPSGSNVEIEEMVAGAVIAAGSGIGAIYGVVPPETLHSATPAIKLRAISPTNILRSANGGAC